MRSALRGLRPLRAGIALALAAIAAPDRPALASQYPLDQAVAIIPRADAARLRKAGIQTTLDLLTYGRTADERKRLAERAKLPVEKVAAWVALADLMRVRGIGPDVARLLTAAGVRTLAELQGADPVAVGQAMQEINKAEHLSPNPPRAESISYWIAQARLLPVVLE